MMYWTKRPVTISTGQYAAGRPARKANEAFVRLRYSSKAITHHVFLRRHPKSVNRDVQKPIKRDTQAYLN